MSQPHNTVLMLRHDRLDLIAIRLNLAQPMSAHQFRRALHGHLLVVDNPELLQGPGRQKSLDQLSYLLHIHPDIDMYCSYFTGVNIEFKAVAY